MYADATLFLLPTYRGLYVINSTWLLGLCFIIC